jgi:drug/metabolite transporter (DMT)-like permease
MPQKPPTTAVLWFNMVVIYIVWGSTYAAIAITGETIPPLTAMAIRFLTAAACLAIILKLLGKKLSVTPKELVGSGFIGIMLLGMGIGGVALGERVVPTGVTSLLICGTPLWMAIFRTLAGDRPRPLALLGVFVGLLGMAYLVLPGNEPVAGADPDAVLPWSIVILVGSLCWSAGSFLASRITVPKDLFVLSMWEMVIGGLFLGIVGFAIGERYDASVMSTESFWGLIYLITVGSLFAYSSYVWLLGNAPISLVATYAYVNPLVAVAIGILLLDESLTANMFIGGAIVVVGVILTISAERNTNRPPIAAE